MSTELLTVDAGGEVRAAPPAVPLFGGPEAVQAAIRALNAVREFVAAELKENHDYGVVPGTRGKPSLFKPGAEKIAMYFNCWPQYEVQALPIGEAGHVEYLITCRLISRATGAIVGSGVGSCSTMESKYRYRTEWRGKQKSRVEHPDIADVRNTVLKMAKKRAQVDAALSLSCVSDLFTQDLEDLQANREAAERQRAAPARTAAPRRPAPRPAAPRYGDWVRAAADKIGISEYQLSNHLWKWAAGLGWLDGHDPNPGAVPHRDKFGLLDDLFQVESAAFRTEARAYDARCRTGDALGIEAAEEPVLDPYEEEERLAKAEADVEVLENR